MVDDSTAHLKWISVHLKSSNCPLYLAVLSRPPGEDERKLAAKYLAESNGRRSGAEDLMWALLTSDEFLFNH